MNIKMGFKEYTEENKNKVHSIIQACLKKQLNGLEDFTEIVKDYPNRQGKYGRPMLLTLWCELNGGNLESALLPAGAQQLSEDWILIHDDIMDNNDKRRGKKSLHKLHDVPIAINAGDSLHMIMWGMIYDAALNLDYAYEDGRGERLFRKFSHMLLTTAEGQHIDISLTNRKDISKFTLEDYFQSIHAKSGYYSVYGPMQLGMIVAGMQDKEIQKVEEYGSLIGKAFQIKDDILDCEAYFDAVAAKKLGKKPGNDVWEGTKTGILWHFYNKSDAPADAKEKVRQIYMLDRENKIEDEVAYVLQQFKDYGSLEYAKTMAKEFAQQALGVFDRQTADLDSRYKEIARDAINVMEKRDK